LCLFSFGFLQGWRGFGDESRARKSTSAEDSQRATTLLRFVAGAKSAVPICIDRHNSATGYLPVFASQEARSTAAVAAQARRTKGIRGLLPAKELGKSWRFFPTYVEV
jgi:hypothetical protein